MARLTKKEKSERTSKYWHELLEECRVIDIALFEKLAEMKPFYCTRRRLDAFSDQKPIVNKEAERLFKEASSSIWNYPIQVHLHAYPNNEQIKPGHPEPDPVRESVDSEYPKKAAIKGHYPNNRIILTSEGNARCRDAKAFPIGMIVPVELEGDWLVIKGIPRSRYKYA